MRVVSAATLNDIMKEYSTAVYCFALKVIATVEKSSETSKIFESGIYTDIGLIITETPTVYNLTFRFINDTVDATFKEKYYDEYGDIVESKGPFIYKALPFEVSLPKHEENEPPKVQCSIFNIGPDIVSSIRAINSPLSANLSLVSIRTINSVKNVTIEIGPLDLAIVSADITESVITFSLSYEYFYLNEPFMKYRFTPDTFPGLFE